MTDRQYLSVRECIDVLMDGDTFRPAGTPVPAALGGYGEIFGRTVLVHASGGLPLETADYLAMSEIYKDAALIGCPVLRIFNAPGARLSAGILAAQEIMMRQLCGCSGRSARLAIVTGPAIGADAVAAGLHDVRIMARQTSAFCVSGPSVLFPVANDDISLEDLAGADVHATSTGLSDITADNEVEALLAARRLVSTLPARSTAAHRQDEEPSGELDTLLPIDALDTYDVLELVERVSDGRDFLEIGNSYAPNVITGLSRIGGMPVGVLGTRPEVLGGVLDIPACRKIAHFARLCRTLSLPVLKILDVPGFLPAAANEHGGITGEAARVVSELSRLDSVTLVLRNALGPAFLVLTASSENEERLCWNDAEIAPCHGHPAGDMGFTSIPPRESRTHLLAAFARLRQNRSTSRP